MKPLLSVLGPVLLVALNSSDALAKAGAGSGVPKLGRVQTPRDDAVKYATKFDKNGNGKIDGTEIDVVRTDFEKNPKGPLMPFDVDHNGTLDDVEIAAIDLPKYDSGKKKEKKKGSSNPFNSSK